MNQETIKQIVESHFKIEISKETRQREYVEARGIYYKLTRDNTRLSLTAIGKPVNKHYSSVIHGIIQIENWIERDVAIRNNYTVLKNKVKDIKEATEEVLVIDESIVLKYATLKDEVKSQREEIQRLTKEYNELYEKHNKREKFYQKYGFIG